MPLTETGAIETAAKLLKIRDAERGRLDRIHAYLRNRVCKIYMPRSATTEYRQLVEQARVNVLPLLVTEVAQNLFIEGYRPARSAENAGPWEIWQANRMDARQAAIWRPALKYGLSYTVVLPGSPTPVIRPKSPRLLTAVYEDPAVDEWPVYALEVTDGWGPEGPRRRLRLLDDINVYTLYGGDDASQTLRFEKADAHELGVCPVVRYLCQHDEEDGSPGEVEEHLPLQDQLNQTTFGLLMAQQYAAFRQRWATGMAIAEDENGNPIEPFNAAVNRLWQAESPDTRFGEFSQTDLAGYLDSRSSTLAILAALSQTPPHTLLVGDAISNLSAEALAAIESGLQRKVAERKTSFGESAEQMLRLAGLAAGDHAAWTDTGAQVVWRDTESRSLAQVADALGKLAQMLGVPARALWERIPGVTQQDIDRWTQLAEADGGLAELTRMLEQASNSAGVGGNRGADALTGSASTNGSAPA